MKKCMMLHYLMKLFVKNDIPEKNNSGLKFVKIDIKCIPNILSTSDLNIGFAAKRNLQKSKASDASKLK